MVQSKGGKALVAMMRMIMMCQLTQSSEQSFLNISPGPKLFKRFNPPEMRKN